MVLVTECIRITVSMVGSYFVTACTPGFDVTYLRRRSERRAVRPILPLTLTLNLRQSCSQYYSNHAIPIMPRTRVVTTFPNCYRTRRGFHLRRLQVTLSAAKLGVRVGAVHEKV